MNNAVKRFFDIVLSAAALIVLSPVLIISAAGIKFSSPGPVFYRAKRVGKNGKYFNMYKFRTMHTAANAVEKSFIADENRIFPFGAFLRKSKIDELPQLFNIITGDMSIVGPRPAAQSNAAEIYVGKYKKIQSIRPGLTSYGSLYDYKFGELFVNDNDKYINTVLPVKLELELYYAEHCSIFSDMVLILLTVKDIFEIVMGKTEFEYTELEKSAVDKIKSDNRTLEVRV